MISEKWLDKANNVAFSAQRRIRSDKVVCHVLDVILCASGLKTYEITKPFL